MLTSHLSPLPALPALSSTPQTRLCRRLTQPSRRSSLGCCGFGIRRQPKAIHRAERPLQLTNLARRHIQIALRRANIGVAQLQLDRPQIGPSIQGFERRGVAQQVQMHMRHTGIPLQTVQPTAQAIIGKGRAVDGLEERRPRRDIALLQTFAQQRLAAQRTHGLATHRNQARLAPLAPSHDEHPFFE